MSNSLRGMIAGFIATLVLSALLIVKTNMGLWPELNLIRLLVNLGSIQTVAAWMDHFIVGVVVWGLMFGAFDALWESRAYWLKGLIFGVFAWLMMMILFMPLAKAGWFGTLIGPSAAIVTLGMHLVYGLVLGVSYGLLTAWYPAKAPERPTAN
ncbi:MAG: hypothetical protein IT536_01125 [Hyphomicrobiales bacterium]|nr:hypothetical protein [Hyphomicrobiales bacterium]